MAIRESLRQVGSKESKFKAVKNPWLLAVAGLATFAASSVDAIMYSDEINSIPLKAYPPLVAKGELASANNQIIDFQRKTAETVKQGASVIDLKQVTDDPEGLKQAFVIKEAEEERTRLRNELEAKLYKEKAVFSEFKMTRVDRDVIAMMLGSAAMFAGWYSLLRPAKRRNSSTA